MLYEALKEENRQTLKVVETDVDDNDASARSVLRKLLKLAVINSELTLDLIKGGKRFFCSMFCFHRGALKKCSFNF